MNKLKTGIMSAIAIVFLSTPLLADSSNFSGPYIGVQTTVNGVELDGSAVSAGDTVGETTTGTAGKFAIIAGGEIGWAIPLGDSLLLDIGATIVDGDAKISTTSSDTVATADVTFEISNYQTAYIAPTIVLSDTSSMYLKFGTTEADTTVTGDVTKPADLSGTTVAFGTRTVLPSGIFLRTEAGYTEFDKLSVTGKGAGGAGTRVETTTTVTADPTVAYGAVTIGFKF